MWLGLTVVILPALIAAARSPLLAWRDPVYILAGFAGAVALCLLLLQPLLALNLLPGLRPCTTRRLHHWTGTVLVAVVCVHVGGLWITSPPDVVDALTFDSPTPFSFWGVLAMWAVFATALLVLRRRRIPASLWRRAHLTLACVILPGTVLHALLIQGTMGQLSKWLLCAAVILALLRALRR